MFQFDELRNNLYKDITAKNIKDFITENQLPTVIEFTQEVCLSPSPAIVY